VSEARGVVTPLRPRNSFGPLCRPPHDERRRRNACVIARLGEGAAPAGNAWLRRERASKPLEPSIRGAANPALSPDGRWLAYDVVQSGRREVYVRLLADPEGSRWQVSTDGGSHPIWARNGSELFYVSSTELMRVDVARSASWAGGRPVKQFDFDFFRGQRANGRVFDISQDGQRFLAITKPGSDAENLPITLVQNGSRS
jgi:hypothetical protein